MRSLRPPKATLDAATRADGSAGKYDARCPLLGIDSSTMNATTLDAAAAVTARRNKLVINLLLVSSFVVILNETIMSVAIPPLMASLGVTAAAAQWVTAAFLLTMAVVIPDDGLPDAASAHAHGLPHGDVAVLARHGRGRDCARPRAARRRARDPSVGHGDHDAAAHDDGHDTRAARDARQDDGRHHDGDLRRPGDRPGAVGADPELSALALAVRPRAAVRARIAVARVAAHRERHHAAQSPARHRVGRAIGVRVRRLRVRHQRARRAAGSGSTAGVGSARRGRHRE